MMQVGENWLGLRLLPIDPGDKPWHLLLVYLMDVGTLILFAGITFKLMKMKGEGIKNFVRNLNPTNKSRGG